MDALVKEFSPTHIYLFGSLVEGTARPESSIDVLIIAPGVDTMRLFGRIKRAIKAANELTHIAPLVYTPEEVELLTKQGDGFIADIIDHGKLLYEKPTSE